MLTRLRPDDVAQYEAILQFNSGYALSEEDSDRATVIVRPKSPPDALVLWDSSNDKILEPMPVPDIDYESGWVPFEDSYGGVNWFDALGVSVPDAEANSGVAQAEAGHRPV